MHVLVIGSSVIDLFLDVDSNFYKIANGNVEFALGDKIPADMKKLSLGGNGANVAVGLTRLEIPTTFYTYLGDDILSGEIQQGLTREGVNLKAEKHEQKSSSLSIIFGFDSDRIIFSHHETRDYTFNFDSEEKFDYVFLTSIGERWEKAYEQILEYVKRTSTPLAFSPGVHQLENMNDTIREIIKSSKIYFSNKDESKKVLGKTKSIDLVDVKELLRGVKQMGPEIVSITDGANGAYAIDSTNQIFKIPPTPAQGHEKTGAGDAYAAAFFASILAGNNVETAMTWGGLNAGGVMEHVGAQTGLLTKTQLDERAKTNNNLKVEKA